MKFKIGDRVKSKHGLGTIRFISQDRLPYLVEHDVWRDGHYGNEHIVEGAPTLSNKSGWYFNESDLTRVVEKEEEETMATDIQVGGIYKVREEHRKKCGSFQEKNGAYIKITAIHHEDQITYDILNKNYEKLGSCFLCLKEKHLEPISIKSSKKGFMAELKLLAKKLIDKDTKTLIKAGFLDGSLEATGLGQSAINAVMVGGEWKDGKDFKKALVTLAQEELDEKKKDE